jgi:hypothetical protein
MFSCEEIIGFLSVNKGDDANDDDSDDDVSISSHLGREGGPVCQRSYRYIAGAWMTQDCPGHITSP